MAVEKDFESVRIAREKEARDNAKAMAQHTQLGQLQKHWMRQIGKLILEARFKSSKP